MRPHVHSSCPNQVTAFVVSAVIGTAGQGLILFAFGDNKQLGYGIAAFVFAVIFVVPPWITFYFTKVNLRSAPSDFFLVWVHRVANINIIHHPLLWIGKEVEVIHPTANVLEGWHCESSAE